MKINPLVDDKDDEKKQRKTEKIGVENDPSFRKNLDSVKNTICVSGEDKV